jgi:hypothetical protein
MFDRCHQHSIRTVHYQKNLQDEELMGAVNQALAPLEREMVATFEAPSYPTIFIVGAPRSGTTLLVQLLITCFELGYINNIAARFWMAPYIGAWLASGFQAPNRPPAVGFSSELGRTPEYEGPHEFGYFWRRWFQYGDTHELSEEQVAAIDTTHLRQELAAIEYVFDRPLLFKNAPALSLQVGFLASVLPEAVFIHCRREHVYVAQSLLLSRLKYYGNKESWFSVKPKEYRWLKERPYVEQIAGQIFYTRRRIEQALVSLGSRRRLNVDYESLCKRPQEVLERVANLVAGTGYKLLQRECVVPDIASTNAKVVDEDEFQRLEEACCQFFDEPAEG